jgi:selenide,water dikinase
MKSKMYVPVKQNESGGCLAKYPGRNLIELVREADNISGCPDIASLWMPEDASVIKYGDDNLLLTTDMAPLVGVDCFLAGKIAVLHALSDIYAMGGRPLHVLVNLVIARATSEQQSTALLAGIFEACREESVLVAGGHTLLSEEFLVGISVLGSMQGKQPIKKQNCLSGDILLLSKPLGTGLAARGLFLGEIEEAEFSEAMNMMLISNRHSVSAAQGMVNIHAMTDVTGFGLLGHLSEMLRPEQGAIIDFARLPIISCVNSLFLHAYGTGITQENLRYAGREHKLSFTPQNDCPLILLDPQTNGAILVAVAPSDALPLEQAGWTPIGKVNDEGTIRCHIVAMHTF